MHRRPIFERQINPPFNITTYVIMSYPVLATVSGSYPNLKGRLPTCYSPVRRSIVRSKLLTLALDLHVLGTPPAFILSQDQTLHDWKTCLSSRVISLSRFAFILCASSDSLKKSVFIGIKR